MADYREELTQAMKTSTLKGFNRIFSASSSLRRTLWIVAVLSSFVICLYNVSSNVQHFLEHPKVLNVDKKLIDFNNPNGTVPIPTVAVCTLNPIGSNLSVFEEHGVPLPRDFHRRVEEVTSCVNCTREKKDNLEVLRVMQSTGRGYYMYVGQEAMMKVANKDAILKCHAYIYIGSALAAFPCEQFTTNYSFIHPDTGLCHVYEPLTTMSQAFSQFSVVGYHWAIHLDNSISNLNTEYSSQHVPAVSSGVKVAVFDPYIVPNTFQSEKIAGAGRLTNLQLKIARIDRLSTPYSEKICYDVDKTEKIPYFDRVYNYDPISCYTECSIATFVTLCNCTDLCWLKNPEKEVPLHEYCLSVNQSAEQIFSHFNCVAKNLHEVLSTCDDRCKEPCKEIEYTLSAASSKWPLPSQVGSFYENIIDKNVALRERYNKYIDIGKAMAAGSGNLSDMDILLASRVIEENFAEVTLQLADTYYTHYESKPQITLGDFVSRLGGALNLWSGITVMFCVEILDLIISMVGLLTNGTRGKGESNQVHSKTFVQEIKI